MNKREWKRIVVGGDLHTGHLVGLTPPQHDPNGKAANGRFVKLRREIWDFYSTTLKQLRKELPISAFIVNGDCIDGQGYRNAGVEEFTTDRIRQSEIAVDCIREAMAGQVFITYGTDAHTGKEEDFEEVITTLLPNAIAHSVIESKLYIDVYGLNFNCRHYVGRSSLPHTRHTAVAKEHLWNQIEALNEEAPLADALIRSHVHYFTYCGGFAKKRLWLGLTAPALQGKMSKFGEKMCTGQVDIGLLVFDVHKSGMWKWEPHIWSIKSQKAKVYKV